MQFNKYNMYSYNAGVAQTQTLDDVDVCRQNLMRMTQFNDVKNYLQSKFGEFEGEKWVNYPELDKHIYININKNKVDFATVKDKKQYWGRSWIFESNKKEKDKEK